MTDRTADWSHCNSILQHEKPFELVLYLCGINVHGGGYDFSLDLKTTQILITLP